MSKTGGNKIVLFRGHTGEQIQMFQMTLEKNRLLVFSDPLL